jgi:hypothetical protein
VVNNMKCIFLYWISNALSRSRWGFLHWSISCQFPKQLCKCRLIFFYLLFDLCLGVNVIIHVKILFIPEEKYIFVVCKFFFKYLFWKMFWANIINYRLFSVNLWDSVVLWINMLREKPQISIYIVIQIYVCKCW